MLSEIKNSPGIANHSLISRSMKRWASLLLSLLLAATLFLGVRYFVRRHAQKKREAVYQQILQSYQQVLKPGMTRKEVEHYLHAKGVTFRQMCCINSKLRGKHSWDDELKIGEEDSPWFCGENNVYVGFEFSDNANSIGDFWRADDLDTLKSVALTHQLEVCL